MKNRFTGKNASSNLKRKIIYAFVISSLCCYALCREADSVRSNARANQRESLEKAILRSAIHCYATEGAYPESLDYIRTHYGIRWDEKKYIVDYEVTGLNLIPGVTVFAIDD